MGSSGTKAKCCTVDGAGCFSRRNKCVVLTLTFTLVFLVLFMYTGMFSGTETAYNGQLCKLEDIELQDHFDRQKFAGDWFVGHTKAFTNPLLASLLEFSDVKINFAQSETDDKDFIVKSVGGKFMGMWCPIGEGHMQARDPDNPQKMVLFFDTPTGKKLGTRPAWLLKTDYTSYAILYSCWDETDNGYCLTSGAYAGVLKRTKDDLPAHKMEKINKYMESACISPKALRNMKHGGYCKSQQKSISSISKR